MLCVGSSFITPTDHIYIGQTRPEAFPGVFDVYAPAGGHVIEIQRSTDRSMPGMPSQVFPDYRVVIAHSCTFFTTLMHLSELAPEIAAAAGPIEQGETWFSYLASGSMPIPVSAGQALARFDSGSIDMGVTDADVTLPGFAIPEHYGGQPWMVHTIDPFDPFVEPIRSSMRAKSLRTAEPRGGKIDNDVAGRIVGNWFREGTFDYDGDRSSGEPSWSGHLAIAYHHIYRSQIRIAIGAPTGISEQQCGDCGSTFAVRGNGPDPASVGVNHGLVKYELVGVDFLAGRDSASRAVEGPMLGVFLVEMLDELTIRTEVVPGAAAAAVDGFSAAASIYRR